MPGEETLEAMIECSQIEADPVKEINVEVSLPLILIVDDDPAMRLLERASLEQAGFQVHEASCGMEALTAFQKRCPDALLLDVMMPDVDGFHVCEEIRKSAAGKLVPIIMVTGLDNADAIDRAFELGATDFICKPINWGVLGHHVRYVLRASTAFKKLKESEAALQVSEERYAIAARGANDGLWDWNIAAGTIFLSVRWKKLIGYDEDEIHSSVNEWFSRVHLDDIEQLRHDISIHLDQSTAHFQSEYRMLHKNGTYRWMLTRGVAVRNEGGTIGRMAGSQTDITERKEHETTVLRSKERLQTFFDGIADPMFMTAIDYEIVIANRAAMEYSDCRNFQDIIGRNIYEILSDHYSIGEDIPKALRAGVQTSFVLQRKGYCLIERLFIYPIILNGRYTGEDIVRIADITKEKVLEQQLVHTEKLAALGLLVAGITHEINNPNNLITFNMSVLRTYMEIILPIVDDFASNQSNFVPFNMTYADFRKEILNLMNDVEHGAKRVSSIVRELREFSHKGDIEERTVISPRELIERAIAICNNSASKKQIIINIREESVFPALNLTAGICEQVLVNLIVNAIHAADKESAYLAFIIKQGLSWSDYLTIIIKDNGTGMDADTLTCIFDPFFTLKPRGEGTGLGLYISKMLIKKIGGDLTCDSTLGEGSIFTITLPKEVPSMKGVEGA